MIELKPCPFCGGRKLDVDIAPLNKGGTDYYAYITCQYCGTEFNFDDGSYDTYLPIEDYRQEIAKRWNKRRKRPD